MTNRVERVKIVPLNTASGHDNPIVINEEMAKKFKQEVIGTPLMWSEDNPGLPQKHSDAKGNRRIIGVAVNSDIITDENGIQYLVGDYEIYEDANKDILDKMEDFNQDSIGASYELFIDSINRTTGEIMKGNFKAASLMDADYSAYGHRALLVASKTETKEVDKMEKIEITYDEAMKKLITENYNVELEKLKTELQTTKSSITEEFNKQITGYKNQLEKKDDEIKRLRAINQNLID